MELIIGTIILNLATKWGSGQFAIHRPLCPEETALGCTLTGGLCGAQTRSGLFRKQRGLLPLTGIEPPDLGYPVHSVITVLTVIFPFL